MTTCATCGAPQGNVPPLYCRFCGARRAGGVDRGFRTDAERYELVEQDPAFAGAMKHAPRLGWGDVLRQIGMFVAACVIATAGLAFTAAAKAGTLFTAAFVGICALVAIAGIYELFVAFARMRAPTRRPVAVLVSDRVLAPTQVRKARLRLRDGEEMTVVADDALLALLVEGDIGVAYLQRDRLVDFRWFDVLPPEDAPGGRHVAPSCSACAAPVTFDTRETCTFCGATLPAPNLGVHAAALAAARAAAAKIPARPARDPRKSAVGPFLLLAFGAFGLFVTMRFQLAWLAYGEHWPWLWAFVAVFVPITGMGAIWVWRRIGPRPAPTRVLGRVLGRRRDVVATVNRRPVYGHYVTVVAENGARVSLRATEAQWNLLPPDDIAVVWERGGVMVDAVRIP